MEDNLSTDRGWGHDFRMIQVRYTYCALCIIITSVAPEIIRHEIPEFGEVGGWRPQLSSSQTAPASAWSSKDQA